MRNPLIVLLVTMTMFPLVPLAYPPSAAENLSIEVSTFGNGDSAITVNFPGPRDR